MKWWVYRCNNADSHRACGIYQADEYTHDPPRSMQGGSDSRDECGHPWSLGKAVEVVQTLNDSRDEPAEMYW